MALIVNGNIELENGLTLNSVYGRTFYIVNEKNKEVRIGVNYWLDETSYTNSLSPLVLGFNIPTRYSYDRTTDGIDVLDFTNQKIKTELEGLGYSVVITEL